MRPFMGLLGLLVVVVGIVAVVYLVSNSQRIIEHEVKVDIPAMEPHDMEVPATRRAPVEPPESTETPENNP